jgi:hypothetical protein
LHKFRVDYLNAFFCLDFHPVFLYIKYRSVAFAPSVPVENIHVEPMCFLMMSFVIAVCPSFLFLQSSFWLPLAVDLPP